MAYQYYIYLSYAHVRIHFNWQTQEAVVTWPTWMGGLLPVAIETNHHGNKLLRKKWDELNTMVISLVHEASQIRQINQQRHWTYR